jgi:hypothetical protein
MMIGVVDSLLKGDPFEGRTEENFGTFINNIVWWYEKLSDQERKGHRGHDPTLLTDIRQWLDDPANGYLYLFFILGHSEVLARHADNLWPPMARSGPVVQDFFTYQGLKALMFPRNCPEGMLAFHPEYSCWTFGLDARQGSTAAKAFEIARLLVTEAYARLIQNDSDAITLYKQYFDMTEDVLDEHQNFTAIKQDFERLHSVLTSGKQMFVLCKGTKKQTTRSVAYVFPAFIANVNPEIARYSNCIFLNDLFFENTDESSSYLVNGEGLYYEGMVVLHELTHLVCNTIDFEDKYYGRKKCFSLARLNTSMAIRNADNFALFARDLKLCKDGQKLHFPDDEWEGDLS